MENNLLGAKLQLNKVNVMRGVDKYSDELGIGIKTIIGQMGEDNRVSIIIMIYATEASNVPEFMSKYNDKAQKEVEKTIMERSEAFIELDYDLILAEGKEYTSDMDEDIWNFIYLQINMQTTLMSSLIDIPSFNLPKQFHSEM